MNPLKSSLPGLRSTLSRRPAAIAGAGVLTVLLTPFVFFPEVMGDAGVTHASALRNGAALAFLVLGALTTLIGAASLGGQLLKKHRVEKVASK